MKRLILFDIDGTLTAHPIGHIEAHAVAYQKVFNVFGSIYMIDYQGKTDRLITKEVLNSLGTPKQEIDSKLEEHFQAMGDYFDAVIPHVKPVVLPGAVEALEMLTSSDENLLGLVTGNLERIALAKLNAAGIGHYFKFGGFGNESEERPQLVINAIEHAAKIHGFVQQEGNVFVIGDTPVDIEAGKAAGAITIGVATGSYSNDDLSRAGATVVLDNLVDQDALNKALGFVK